MEEPAFESEEVESRILEGVSNEALLFCMSCLVVFITTFVLDYYRRKSRPDIAVHPELVEEIREFREVYERVNAPLPDADGVRRIVDGRLRSDGLCPICYDRAKFAVLTDCGHSFCCNCIVGYWRHSASPLTAVACAVCRAKITMLLPISWPGVSSMQNEREFDALHEANMELDDYNRRFSGNREIYSYLTDIPILIPYLVNHFTAYGAMLGMFRLRAYITVACIAIYVLCPLDLLSENVYGVLGLLDDLFMAIVALIYICVALRNFMMRRGEVPLED